MEIGCWNVSQLCRNTNKDMCEQTDQDLQMSIANTMQKGAVELPVACGTAIDTSIKISPLFIPVSQWLGQNPPKICYLGAKFSCPFGYTIYNDYFNQSDAKFNDTNQYGCWQEDKNKGLIYRDCWQSGNPLENVVVYAVNNSWAVNQISAVCCHEEIIGVGNRGVCIKNFDTAYEKQKLESEGIKGNCEGPDKPKECSVTKTITDKAVSYKGKCELQPGFVDNKLQENTLVCMPENSKVCHFGKNDKVMYEKLEACGTRNFKEGYATVDPGPFVDFGDLYYKEAECESYILPSDYPCLDLPAAGSFKEGAGGTGEGGDTGGVQGTINTLKANGGEIEKILEEEVRTTFLVEKLRGQTIGFISNTAPFSPIRTALAAKSIDACKFAEAIIVQESDGKLEGFNDNGDSVDCGLMGVKLEDDFFKHGGTIEDCKDNTKGKNYFDAQTNIEAGVAELLAVVTDPCGSGTNTSCQSARDSGAGKEKLYRYVLSAYNGGKEGANSQSGTPPGTCSIGSTICCTESCKELNTHPEEMHCFIEVGSDATIMPTKVECPKDPGELGKYTYPYVMEKFDDNYNSIDKEDDHKFGDGVASCP